MYLQGYFHAARNLGTTWKFICLHATTIYELTLEFSLLTTVKVHLFKKKATKM